MKSLLNGLTKLHDTVTNLSAILAVVALSLIVSAYLFEVFTRYFLNAPTSWGSDFVSYALSASIFLALPKVTRDRGHVAVTILVDSMPHRLANAVHVGVHLVGFLCIGFTAWVSFQENLRQSARGIMTLAMNPIPVWWVSSFMTFGLLVSAFHMLRQISPSNRIDTGLFTKGAE